MPPQPLSFLDLPGEIRNQIYHHLLILPYQTSKSILYPSLLSTCTQIHTECLPILYSTNTFLAHEQLLLPRLLDYPTIYLPSLVSLIKRYHIRLRLDCDPNFSKEKATAAFSGVEELTIEVFQAQFGSSDFKNLRRFEGVRGVKRVRITGSVTGFLEYVEWLYMAMTCEKGSNIENFNNAKAGNGDPAHYDLWTVGDM